MNDQTLFNLPFSQIKHFSPGSWDSIPTDCNQVKVASVGLGVADGKDALRFMSGPLLEMLKRAELNPNCFYVHKVAMGGSHRYGPNRWGDGFREEVLQRDVGTFEKAKAYRNHKSTKSDPVFGRVKFARFRDEDGVVELVTEYFGNEKVASMFGGKVADQEIESLLKTGSIPVSMGSMVPGDTCSVCNHFARKPADRCMSVSEGGKCAMFGCKTGMLKIDKSGRLQFVDNPRNRFYDISKVAVGADPIAYGSIIPIGDFYSELDDRQRKTAALFEDTSEIIGVNPSYDLYITTIHSLSETEAKLAAFNAESDCDFAVGCHSRPALSPTIYAKLASSNLHMVGATVDSFRTNDTPLDFERFASHSGQSATALAGFIPDMFTRIRQHGLVDKVASMAASIGKFSSPTSVKVASSLATRLDLENIKRTSLSHLATGWRATPIALRPAADTIPDVVLKFAAIRVLLDTNLNGDQVNRFLNFNRTSTRLAI